MTVFDYGLGGVRLFFVLSAFLLTRNLLKENYTLNTVPDFFRRRALRILPLYLCLILVSILFQSAVQHRDPTAHSWLFSSIAPLWTYATFTQNFWLGLNKYAGWDFLSVTWSLAVEEHFYIALPFLALWLNRRQFYIIALAMIVLGPIIRVLVYGNIGPLAGYAWTISCLDAFGWGILIALWPTIDSDTKTKISVGFGIALAVSGLWFTQHAYAGGFAGHPYAITALTLYSALAVLIVCHSTGPTDRTIERGTPIIDGLAWVGERCYSLYLLHMPIAATLAVAFGQNGLTVTDQRSALVIAIAAVILLPLSALTYRLIERPFIDYGRRNSASKRSIAMPVTTTLAAKA